MNSRADYNKERDRIWGCMAQNRVKLLRLGEQLKPNDMVWIGPFTKKRAGDHLSDYMFKWAMDRAFVDALLEVANQKKANLHSPVRNNQDGPE